MTRKEFGAVIAYLESGCGKKLPANGVEVYWDLLSDLPLAALQAAAKRALLEGQYPVFPPVGTLRKLAVEALPSGRNSPSAIEAWGLLRTALVRYGYTQADKGLGSLPALVAKTARCLGWRELCDATMPDVIRAQFCKAYETVLGREQRERLLPPAMVKQLASFQSVDEVGFDSREDE